MVTDSQGNEFIIPLGSQVEFKLITEFLDPDAAFCESNIVFPLVYDENGNEVVPTFTVPSDDASSFTFDISTYVNGGESTGSERAEQPSVSLRHVHGLLPLQRRRRKHTLQSYQLRFSPRI